jgi:hypothetical protein
MGTIGRPAQVRTASYATAAKAHEALTSQRDGIICRVLEVDGRGQSHWVATAAFIFW